MESWHGIAIERGGGNCRSPLRNRGSPPEETVTEKIGCLRVSCGEICITKILFVKRGGGEIHLPRVKGQVN